MNNKRKLNEQIPMRKHPGDPESEDCSPGSIEQKLDMCEKGSLRGDDVLHSHGKVGREYLEEPLPLDQLMEDNYNVDLSEENREGDEMSGDEHSSGLEGDLSQPGLPGHRSRQLEDLERTGMTLHEEEVIERLPVKVPAKKRIRRKAA